jgi:steroid delta-isomerase-like uncharacterized protein
MSDRIAQRYMDALNTHEATEVGKFMTDDVDFEDVTFGEQLSGRAAVEAFIDKFTATFSSNYRFELITELTTETTMAAEWTVTGDHDRDSDMMPATNRPFTIRGATIARLSDGKLSYSRDYWDMAGFLRQVGVLPA